MEKSTVMKLNNRVEMPSLGLGTWPMKRVLYKVVPLAFLAGYRAFDTSSAYGNEHYLGRVLKFFPRKSVFMTSKLSNSAQRTGDVRRALIQSLTALKTDYLDLYLMHWPNPDTYLGSWRQMEALYKEGLVKAIGVCNFHEHHFEKLFEIASVVPVINQVELHPLLTQKPLVDYCSKKGIAMEAYSPLARMDPRLINHPVLVKLGVKYKKTVPQVVLRWIVQSGYCTCPKSSSFKRIRQNMDIFDFELTDDDMRKIAGINENYRVRHNPDTADFSKL